MKSSIFGADDARAVFAARIRCPERQHLVPPSTAGRFGMVTTFVPVHELWPRWMCMSMMGLGLSLRDRGGWVDACIDRVSTDGYCWVKCFGVEIFQVKGIIRPGHGIWHPCCSVKLDPTSYLVLRCSNQVENAFLDPSMRTRFRSMRC